MTILISVQLSETAGMNARSRGNRRKLAAHDCERPT
jgi:hypothetical protein